MRKAKITSIINTLIKKPKIIFESKKYYEYLFIISHMRSYSSLLSHILGSNSQILGYKENHISYNNNLSFFLLRVLNTDDNKKDYVYLLDKILHNNHTINVKILKNYRHHIILLLRNPIDTIKSIVKLNYLYAPKRKIWNAWDAYKYYYDRLDWITKFITEYNNNNNILLLKSEDLIDFTDLVLKKVSLWLNLKNDLTQYYQIFKDTGLPGYGDPSINIKKGMIVKNREKNDIYIPTKILDGSIEKYNNCINTLEKYGIYNGK